MLPPRERIGLGLGNGVSRNSTSSDNEDKDEDKAKNVPVDTAGTNIKRDLSFESFCDKQIRHFNIWYKINEVE